MGIESYVLRISRPLDDDMSGVYEDRAERLCDRAEVEGCLPNVYPLFMFSYDTEEQRREWSDIAPLIRTARSRSGKTYGFIIEEQLLDAGKDKALQKAVHDAWIEEHGEDFNDFNYHVLSKRLREVVALHSELRIEDLEDIPDSVCVYYED